MRFTWLVALLGLSVLVVPLGGLVLLGFLVFGRSWITTSAYGWYTIWTSPDEAAPGGERFVWSRDGRFVLLLAPKLHAYDHACLDAGEYLYLLVDAVSGTVRSNATQQPAAPFTVLDLAGIDFVEPLRAGAVKGDQPWNRRCGPRG